MNGNRTEASPDNEEAVARKTQPGPDDARAKRVVTFVTNRELERLEQIAQEEDRALSTLVHRIIAQYLENKNGQNKNQ